LLRERLEEKVVDGKVAIVTGGSRGIGLAISRRFASAGARVALCARNLERAEAVASELRGNGHDARAYRTDVSDSASVKEMVKSVIDAFGTVDILVNNAGITSDTLLVRMKDSDWQDVLATNLTGAFNCIRAVARVMMRNRHGRIVNISSVVGLAGNVGQANYAASKAGIIGLTKSAAKELAPRGITVNAVAPGFIETGLTDSLGDETQQKALALIPLSRFGTADEVAEAVLFLVSDAAGYITGHVLTVDGGMAM